MSIFIVNGKWNLKFRSRLFHFITRVPYKIYGLSKPEIWIGPTHEPYVTGFTVLIHVNNSVVTLYDLDAYGPRSYGFNSVCPMCKPSSWYVVFVNSLQREI